MEAEAGAAAGEHWFPPATRISRDLARESWRRPWYSQVPFLVWVLITVPAIWLCDWVLPACTRPPGGPIVFALVIGIVGVVVQPVLVWAAVRLGWLGVLVLTSSARRWS